MSAQPIASDSEKEDEKLIAQKFFSALQSTSQEVLDSIIEQQGTKDPDILFRQLVRLTGCLLCYEQVEKASEREENVPDVSRQIDILQLHCGRLADRLDEIWDNDQDALLPAGKEEGRDEGALNEKGPTDIMDGYEAIGRARARIENAQEVIKKSNEEIERRHRQIKDAYVKMQAGAEG